MGKYCRLTDGNRTLLHCGMLWAVDGEVGCVCVCICVWDGDMGNIQGLFGLSTQFCQEPKTALTGKVY